jgi:hypothetical protein
VLRRRCGSLLAIAGLVGATLLVSTGSQAATMIPVPTPAQTQALGSVYTNADVCVTKRPLDYWAAALGKTPGVYSTYGPDFSIADAAAAWGVPRLLTCWAAQYPTSRSIVALPAPVPTAAVSSAELASYTSLATSMKQINNGNDTIRLGWEFNGSWMPWSVTNGGAYFIANWQKIVTTMRAIAPNLKFDWNVTNGYVGTSTGLTDARKFYPGDAYVDDIGIDVYDEDWSNCTGLGPGYPLPYNDNATDTALRQRFVANAATYAPNAVGGIPVSLNGWWLFAIFHKKTTSLDEWGLDHNTGTGTKTDCTSGNFQGGNDDPIFIDYVAHFAIASNLAWAIYFDYCDVASCSAGVDARIDAGHSPVALSHLVKAIVQPSP